MTEKLPRRRNVRIPSFDYSSGGYFITICTQNKRCLFGEIVDYKMRLNELGIAVRDSFLEMIDRYEVELDEWVLMPNHLHAIVVLTGGKPLGQIIGAFKLVSTRVAKAMGSLDPTERLWQRNYYEHWIRSEKRLWLIRQYVRNNPEQWAADAENPDFSPDLRGKGIMGANWLAPVDAGVR